MITKRGPIRVQQVTVIIMTKLQAVFCFVFSKRAIIQDYVANLNQVSVTCIFKTIAEVIFSCHGSLENQLQDKSEEERQKYCTEHKTQRLISIQSPHTLLSAVSSMHSFNCMC